MIINRSRSRKKLAIVAAAALLLGVGTLVFTELTDRTYLFHNRIATPGVIPSTAVPSEKPVETETKDAPAPSDNESTVTNGPKEGDASSEAQPSGSPPITPFGNFVSNHSPNLDGNPAPSSVDSVCNTTPGTTCMIEFTNQNGVVKSLQPQKTDSNGATYWNWDVDKAGFTVGTWKIKVTATLNGQTSTAEDINLEVGP